MKIKKVISYLESIAPSSYQESYDNAGLIVGYPDQEITGVLLCLDSTEAVLDEAIEKGCNLIIAHHPIVFRGLKRFNGRSYVERVVMKAIKHDLAIYASHTNLDNVKHGVNAKICEKLGLKNTRILAPKAFYKRLFTFLPVDAVEKVRKALLEADSNAQLKVYAAVGAESQGEHARAKMKLEVRYPLASEGKLLGILKAMHPDASPVIDIIASETKHPEIGSGMIGELAKPMDAEKFLAKLKKTMKAGCVRHTELLGKQVKKVAVCGGSGGFLLRQAFRNQADVFVTADYKYHEFFDADGKIVIADIGHYESEQFTIELFNDLLTKNFSTFAVHLTEINTNPVNYL